MPPIPKQIRVNLSVDYLKKKKTYLEVSINRVPLSMNKTLGSIPSIGEIDNERIFT